MQNLIWKKGLVIWIILLFLGTASIPTTRAAIVWDVTITCSNAGSQNDYVVIGEASDATDGPPQDSYDVLSPPPPQTPYIRTWLNDNLPYPYDTLTKDYRSYPDSSKEWNLTVQWMPSSGASPTTIAVSWESTEFAGREYTSVNLCNESGAPLQNMLTNNNYIFSCPAYVPQNFKILCSMNNPPEFGAPSPANDSTNNPLGFTWGIPITDPEGDLFSWSIQCSNGQSISASDATGGTKNLAFTGLSYSTAYKVWVNATDPGGSGSYTRKWYTFDTKASLPPVFGAPTPSNGSSNNPKILNWGIQINDPEGDLFSWTIQCSNGQSNSGNGASNGTKTVSLSGLTYLTTYKVWVNATDPAGSGLYIRRWYTFTTKASLPPVFTTPTPSNGSSMNPVSLSWGITINDPEGDLFSWSIQCSNGQVNSGAGAANGTKTLALSGLAYSTTYKVWVNATDPTGSGLYTRRWYTFTTKANLPPVLGTPTPANGSAYQLLSFTWSIPVNDPEGNTFIWTIQCNNGQTSGTAGASNGSKSLALSGLAYLTTYKIWVNATDPAGSGLYIRRWYTFTTKALNNPPVFGTPSPANGSANNLLGFTWGIPINDLEGDLFSWSVQCSNGQFNSGAGATGGTKTLLLSGLAYSTTYKVWVNATDPTGSGTYMRRWYTFTTQQQNNPPYQPSNPGPSSGAMNVAIPVLLTWTGGDPNAGDTVLYDVYFGTSGSPTILSHNVSGLSFNPGTLGYSTTYYWKIVSWDNHGASTVGPVWHFTTNVLPNSPPYIPGTPVPANGATAVAVTSNLGWAGGDPDGDSVLYDVYFGLSSSPSIVSHNQSGLSYDLGTLGFSTTYYWKIVAWDDHSTSTIGPVWHFTTASQSGGGGGGGGGGEEPPVGQPNKTPVANASAGEPYQGFVNSEIMFNGSHSYDPDGNITTWFWVFGDTTTGTGKTVTHTYSQPGTYNVTFTVTDDDGATSTDTITCTITQPNRPPSKPIISGPTNGTKNTLYMYSAVSTDADNDTIQYTFDWGNSLIQPSRFLPSSTSFTVNHSWAAPGRYRLTVIATDNHTVSSSEIIVYIDAVQADGIGYLLDNDSDGIYDAFYSEELQHTVAIQNEADRYTIDSDGDGDWDYTYSLTNGLTPYEEPTRTYGFEIIVALIALSLYLFWRRKPKKEK